MNEHRPPLADAPDGMPDPNVAPPQIARSGDPFARLRIIHHLSRLPRNVTLPGAGRGRLPERRLPRLVLQREGGPRRAGPAAGQLGISFHGDDRIVLDRDERGHTLLIVDSTRMTAFLVAEGRRAADEADEELRRFTLGDGVSPDN